MTEEKDRKQFGQFHLKKASILSLFLTSDGGFGFFPIAGREESICCTAGKTQKSTFCDKKYSQIEFWAVKFCSSE